MFWDHAFHSQSLNDYPSVLSRLRIHESGNELKLHLNDEFKNQYIFRKCEKTSLGSSTYHTGDDGWLGKDN